MCEPSIGDARGAWPVTDDREARHMLISIKSGRSVARDPCSSARAPPVARAQRASNAPSAHNGHARRPHNAHGARCPRRLRRAPSVALRACAPHTHDLGKSPARARARVARVAKYGRRACAHSGAMRKDTARKRRACAVCATHRASRCARARRAHERGAPVAQVRAARCEGGVRARALGVRTPHASVARVRRARALPTPLATACIARHWRRNPR